MTKRLADKAPRWVVQSQRGSSGARTHVYPRAVPLRWCDRSQHYDVVEAFNDMSTLPDAGPHRVWDRKHRVEVLWPAEQYTLPDDAHTARMRRKDTLQGYREHVLGRYDSARFVPTPARNRVL